MKSIKLDLDALTVESFETAEGERETRGTVRAHEITEPDWETCGTCDPRLTVCGGHTNCDACGPQSHYCIFTQIWWDVTCAAGC